MKYAALLGVVAFGLIIPAATYAGELKAGDIEIISVVPRSPDVKPYAMTVPADGHKAVTHVAAATDGEAQKLASAEVPKADSAAGEKQ